MGATVCEAVANDDELELVAACDPACAGDKVGDLVPGIAPEVASLGIVGDVEELVGTAEVAIDFTTVDAARQNLPVLARGGVHAVVGTTGFTPDDLQTLEATFTTSNCIVAPNFAIGAVLMMRFAEIAAEWFDSAEVIELHHDQKIDAPSGTAVSTLARMAAASDRWSADPTEREVVPGARGGKGPGGIPVHSVRLRGLVAHQEVLLGTTGQTLTIRHDSYDRSSFMPGVLLAAKSVADRPGLTVGLDALLALLECLQLEQCPQTRFIQHHLSSFANRPYTNDNGNPKTGMGLVNAFSYDGHCCSLVLARTSQENPNTEASL